MCLLPCAGCQTVQDVTHVTGNTTYAFTSRAASGAPSQKHALCGRRKSCAAVERAFAAAWKAAGLDLGPPPPAGKGDAATPAPAGPRASGGAAAGEPGNGEEEERKRGSGKGMDVARADRRRAEDLRVRVLQGQARELAAVQEHAPAAAAPGSLERELAERRAAERRIAQQWVALQARRAQAAEAAAAAQVIFFSLWCPQVYWCGKSVQMVGVLCACTAVLQAFCGLQPRQLLPARVSLACCLGYTIGLTPLLSLLLCLDTLLPCSVYMQRMACLHLHFYTR